jgi:hypothetical protein
MLFIDLISEKHYYSIQKNGLVRNIQVRFCRRLYYELGELE